MPGWFRQHREPLVLLLALGVCAFVVVHFGARWKWLETGAGGAANLSEFLGLAITVSLLVVGAFKLTALSRTIQRVNSTIILHELTAAVRLARDLQIHARSAKWARAVDRCEDLSPLLASLVDHSELNKEEQGEVLRSITEVGLIKKHCAERESSDTYRRGLAEDADLRLDWIIVVLSRLAGRRKVLSVESNDG